MCNAKYIRQLEGFTGKHSNTGKWKKRQITGFTGITGEVCNDDNNNNNPDMYY